MNKGDILLHPVRMKIIRTLMSHNKNGLTPLEMAEIIKDVPQATLYRHIQVLAEAEIIRILKEKKVRAVTEKYYTLDMEEARLDSHEWDKYSATDKLNYYFYYQISLFNQYQSYLDQLENKKNVSDQSTFSMIELKLNDHKFRAFESELNDLLVKYYHAAKENTEQNTTTRTVGITIIPEA